jgi:hypothetical protein
MAQSSWAKTQLRWPGVLRRGVRRQGLRFPARRMGQPYLAVLKEAGERMGCGSRTVGQTQPILPLGSFGGGDAVGRSPKGLCQRSAAQHSEPNMQCGGMRRGPAGRRPKQIEPSHGPDVKVEGCRC